MYDWAYLVCHLRGKAEDAGSWRIVLGKHQLKRSETAERIFPVKRIYRHENFRYPAHSELDYDIALVKAATDINPSNFIRYACLPRKQTSLNPGHYCWVTGWGDTRGEWRRVAVKQRQEASVTGSEITVRRLFCSRTQLEMFQVRC